MIKEILEFNENFVQNKEYEPYITSKYPDKKLAILTCMDTRLTVLLPAALGLKNGDAKIIKNAGGVVNHPYGSVMRSLLVGILEIVRHAGIDLEKWLGSFDSVETSVKETVDILKNHPLMPEDVKIY